MCDMCGLFEALLGKKNKFEACLYTFRELSKLGDMAVRKQLLEFVSLASTSTLSKHEFNLVWGLLNLSFDLDKVLRLFKLDRIQGMKRNKSVSFPK